MTALDPIALTARLAALPAAAPLRTVLDRVDADVYLVGGAVRDLARGDDPLDLDLVVVGSLEPLIAALGGAGGAVTRFGTATVTGPDGVRCDLAQARRETYPHPGALPEVALAARIDEDLARRDFTVNALALGLRGHDAGRLRSVEHAGADLAAGVLRVLHPGSFRDDPTRLLRLARYAARLGFAVEPSTAARAEEAVVAGALATVSGARIGAELVLLAGEDDPVAGFAALHRLGIDGGIAPGFGLSEEDATPAAARRALALLPADGDPVALGLGIALREVSEDRRRKLLDAWEVGARRRQAALAVARVDELSPVLERARRPSEIATALERAPVEAVALAGALGSPGALAGAREWLVTWRHVGPGIRGDDLIAAGIAPGPAIAAGLRAARDARLDGWASTPERALAVALGAARSASGAI